MKDGSNTVVSYVGGEIVRLNLGLRECISLLLHCRESDTV